MTKKLTLVEAAADILATNLSNKGKGEPFGAGFTRPAQPAGKMTSDNPEGHGQFFAGPVVDPAKSGVDAAIAHTPKATPPGTSPQAASHQAMQDIHKNHGVEGQHRASPTDDGVVHEDQDKDKDKTPVKEGVKTDTTKSTPTTMSPETPGFSSSPMGDAKTEGQPIEGGAKNVASPVSDRVKTYFREKGAALAISEDVNALFNGHDLTEDFKSKARFVFEAAVIAVATKLVEGIEAEYVKQLQAVSESQKTVMESKLDEYMTYMTEQWLKENQVAVEKSLRADLMESFADGLRKLLVDHWIDVPEDKANVLDEMADKIETLEAKINETTEQNVALNAKLVQAEKQKIFESVVSGLTDVESGKIKSLAEAVTWTSAGEYTKNLETLKESYFPKDKVKVASPEALNESTARDKGDENKDAKVLVEGTDTTSMNPRMNRYLSTLKKQVQH